jgi:hypothetical protein
MLMSLACEALTLSPIGRIFKTAPGGVSGANEVTRLVVTLGAEDEGEVARGGLDGSGHGGRKGILPCDH